MSYKKFLIFKVINQERPDLPNEKAEKRTKKSRIFVTKRCLSYFSFKHLCCKSETVLVFSLSTTLLSEKVTPASFPLKTSVIRSQKHKQHHTS